jgi:hypothetical protein
MTVALSTWPAAYAYAAAMAEIAAERDAQAGEQARDYSAAQVMIARAITIDAARRGIHGSQVEDLGAVPLVELYLNGLHPLKAVLAFPDQNLGCTPEPSEPGFDAFALLWQVIQARDATVEDLLTDKDLDRQVQDDVEKHWMANIEIARGVVLVSVNNLATDLHAPAPLALLTELARRHVRAADDQQ